MQLLTSSQPTRHRRATGAAGRGREKAADREKNTQRADELFILSELRNINVLAAKRYLEWLVVGRGLGRGGKETAEEEELFEELVWNCVEEVLDYVGDEAVGKLWRAKGLSTIQRCRATSWLRLMRSASYSGIVCLFPKHRSNDVFATSTEVGFTAYTYSLIFTITVALTIFVLFRLYDPRLPIKACTH